MPVLERLDEHAHPVRRGVEHGATADVERSGGLQLVVPLGLVEIGECAQRSDPLEELCPRVVLLPGPDDGAEVVVEPGPEDRLEASSYRGERPLKVGLSAGEMPVPVDYQVLVARTDDRLERVRVQQVHDRRPLALR